MFNNNEVALNPTQANTIFIVYGVFLVFASTFVTRKFERREILIIGYAAMAVMTFFLAIFVLTKVYVAVIIFFVFYMVTSNILNGSIIFLYIAECATDHLLCICSALVWTLMFLIALITPVAAAPPALFIFAMVCLGASVMSYYYIRETQTKTDKQKKILSAEDGYDIFL